MPASFDMEKYKEKKKKSFFKIGVIVMLVTMSLIGRPTQASIYSVGRDGTASLIDSITHFFSSLFGKKEETVIEPQTPTPTPEKTYPAYVPPVQTTQPKQTTTSSTYKSAITTKTVTNTVVVPQYISQVGGITDADLEARLREFKATLPVSTTTYITNAGNVSAPSFYGGVSQSQFNSLQNQITNISGGSVSVSTIRGALSAGTGISYDNTTGVISSTEGGVPNCATGVNSIALGCQSSASGYYGNAFGFGAIADNYRSSALGIASNAGGCGSVAIGNNASASGCYAVSFGTNPGGSYGVYSGQQNSASGDLSTAVGVGNLASGCRSSASGYVNTASGYRSSTFGYCNTVSGIFSSVSGYRNSAAGDLSSAFGLYNTASGSHSSASGYLNSASATFSSSFGYKLTNATACSAQFGGIYGGQNGYLSISSTGANFCLASGSICLNGTPIGGGGASFSTTTLNSLTQVQVGCGNCACTASASAFGVGSTASGYFSSVLGNGSNALGFFSSAFGYHDNALVNFSSAMGAGNSACGLYSTASGYRNATCSSLASAFGSCNTASAYKSSAFGTCLINSTGCSAQFGGIYSGTNAYMAISTAGVNFCVPGNITQNGGVLNTPSDRNLKENFTDVDKQSILEKINSLPMQQWNYKSQDPTVTHIAPIAQDFYAAFNLNNSSTSISVIDPAGIALIGIQALSQRLDALTGSSSFQSLSINLNSVASSSNSSVLSILQSFGAEVIDGVAWLKEVFVERLTAKDIKVENGITIKDKVTGEYYCITMVNGSMQNEPGECTDVPQPTISPVVIPIETLTPTATSTDQTAQETSTSTTTPTSTSTPDTTSSSSEQTISDDSAPISPSI